MTVRKMKLEIVVSYDDENVSTTEVRKALRRVADFADDTLDIESTDIVATAIVLVAP